MPQWKKKWNLWINFIFISTVYISTVYILIKQWDTCYCNFSTSAFDKIAFTVHMTQHKLEHKQKSKLYKATSTGTEGIWPRHFLQESPVNFCKSLWVPLPPFIKGCMDTFLSKLEKSCRFVQRKSCYCWPNWEWCLSNKETINHHGIENTRILILLSHGKNCFSLNYFIFFIFFIMYNSGTWKWFLTWKAKKVRHPGHFNVSLIKSNKILVTLLIHLINTDFHRKHLNKKWRRALLLSFHFKSSIVSILYRTSSSCGWLNMVI